jgi:hypothetical protein
MFPAGWPGFALLILRASVAMTLVVRITTHRAGLSVWITGASLIVGAALSAGFMTPIAALLTLGLHALIWSSLGAGDPGTVAAVCVDAIVLGLLGPGAYSLDARRYGRQLVIQTPP